MAGAQECPAVEVRVGRLLGPVALGDEGDAFGSVLQQVLGFATEVGLAPSKSAVYDDPALAKANPFMQSLKSVFVGATPRPVTPKYPQVTLVLQSQLSKALTSGGVAAQLQSAKSQIEAIVKG